MENKQIINGIKIYSLDYLLSNDLTEGDLDYLIDQHGLLYSIIVNMYYHIHSKRTIQEILQNIKKDNQWLHKNRWSYKERQEYENIISKILKNIYYYSDYISQQKAEWYMTIYGFDIE